MYTPETATAPFVTRCTVGREDRANNAIRYAKEHTKRTLIVKLQNMDESDRVIFVKEYATAYPAQKQIIDDALGSFACE